MSHFFPGSAGGPGIGANLNKFSPFDGTDNRKLKTPFYQVTIMTADKKNQINLPPQLSRLISKVEVNEVYDVGCFHPLTITVTFIEGSREPFPLNTDNDSNVNTLYGLGANNKASLTNLIGMLTDLKFQGDAGNITALVTNLAAQQSQLQQSFAVAASGHSTEDAIKLVNSPSVENSGNYLFKQGNILKLTWGYQDDQGNATSRIAAGVITVIQADYPENDMPSLTITCQPLTTVFDQVAPIKAISFNTTSALSAAAPSTFQDMTISEVVLAVADMCGIPKSKVIISETLLASLLDPRHVKVWVSGQSLHEFLSELAHQCLAYYTIILDSDQEFVLVFLSRADMEKQVKLNAIGTNLFAYKQPGSILKSISVRAAFDAITTTTFTGVDITGKNTTYSAYHGGLGQVTYSNQKFAATTPDSDNSGSVITQLTDSLPGSDYTGTTSVKPYSDNPTTMAEAAGAKAACATKLVSLEFSSIGFHLLKAGEPVLVTNIGERFSTVYAVQEVTHTLDSDGYNCHGTLRSALYAANGNSTEKTQEGTVPDQIDVEVAEPVATAYQSPKDKYDSIVIG